jgi:peptidyl-prolyl cis-trans isomerase C
VLFKGEEGIKMGRARKTNYYLILLSCLALTFCFSSTSIGTKEVKKQSETKDRKIVAKVNGRPIYEDQITPEVMKGLKKFKKYGMRKDSPEFMRRLKEKALNKAIGQELIYQEGQKLTIKDLDGRIERKLQAMKRRYPTEEQFENHLKRRSLTIKGLRESLKKRVYIDEYLKKQGISEPEIPDGDIRRFYDSNPDSYYRDETVKVSHILIKVDEKTAPEEKKKAREKAERIRKEILAGKDFAEMAKEHSECNSASGGGDLRYIKKGYMPEGFDKVAFALGKGEVSKVVETKFGYHIIKVFEETPEGIAPYHEVKDFIKKFLLGEESKKKLAAHIAELKAKAKIDIFLDDAQKE